MNKKELTMKMAQSANISRKAAAEALDGFLRTVTDAVRNGEKVQLTGFGTFRIVERAARNMRNPQSGETMAVPAGKVVKFKPGTALVDAVK